MSNRKTLILDLFKKYKIPTSDFNYNLFTSGALDSMQLMNFIIDLEKIIKKKIDPSKLNVTKNQSLKGLIKMLNLD